MKIIAISFEDYGANTLKLSAKVEVGGSQAVVSYNTEEIDQFLTLVHDFLTTTAGQKFGRDLGGKSDG